MEFLQLIIKTLRLSIIRVGIGWMFALLTFNFNRVSITDLGAVAVIVTTLIGLHHFLSPFQVFWGRLADRYPIAGYRRTPYIIVSALLGSLVFLALPELAINLSKLALHPDRLAVILDTQSVGALATALLLFLVFGLAMSANGTATFALVAEVTDTRERGFVIAVTQTVLILSAIVSAGVAKEIMPTYTPEQMQFLYNLTPFIAVGSTLLGVLGIERRISREEHTALLAREAEEAAQRKAARQPGKAGGLLGLPTGMPRKQTGGFFAFVLLAIMGIFLQDTILEVFGGEVFGLSVGETTSFTQTWGGGVLFGMLLIGLNTVFMPLSKKLIATLGGLGTALGLGLLAAASLSLQPALLQPALLLMGVSVGFFNVGAMSMMMEMTVEGQTGVYMGLWGMAQGLGNGLANIAAGGLHTLLIESALLLPSVAYGAIFGLEALLMLAAIAVLRFISPQEFQRIAYRDMTAAMALESAN